jgi:hypothetical protein
LIKYRVQNGFRVDVGFVVTASSVTKAAELTNAILMDLPAGLYRSLDFKTISAVVGSVFCDALASRTKGIVNPIEKGHPDIIPPAGAKATEAQLRNYPQGLEVKCTVGNIQQGADLRAGEQRVDKLTGITWQAHHREVKELMGLVWDFVQAKEKVKFPGVTGVFYAANLRQEDWGEISGTTGRNTKVTGMRTSGKQKMGTGWVMLIDERAYVEKYSRVLGFALPRREHVWRLK